MHDSPLGKAIVGVTVTPAPLVGPVIGLIFSILAFNGGCAALERANARPNRAGRAEAIVTKWLGFGGIIQNSIAMLALPLELLILLL